MLSSATDASAFEALRSYPVPCLLENLESGAEPEIPYISRMEQSYVTACFSDIHHYTMIARSMSLYQAVELLNEYYRRMISHAVYHNAVIEEYLGDGIYLSFQHDSRAEAALHALKCAIAMQEDYFSLVQEWRVYGYPVSDSNYQTVGIASGYVYQGPIGHPKHRSRKLIGNAINTAAHLVEEGKKHDACILVSEETRDLVGEAAFQFTQVPSDSYRAYKLLA